MSRNYLLFLNDMRKACERIIRYVQGMNEEAFLADEKTYDAVIRQMIIIGEAAKQIPPEVRTLYPSVEWKEMGRFRDLAIHHYFGIDDKLLWNIASNEITPLLTALGPQQIVQIAP